MYPRNAASPPRIAIGAVVQISDGAVQSSGVSVVVRPEGGSESAGGGTISYGGTSNVVYYQPTQAETDYTAFVVTAYKTGCVPVSVTVITTASATAGYGGVDWSKVTAATTTVNLSGTTIKTATDVETDTADIQARLPAALVSGRIDASVGAMAANTLTASAMATDAVTEIQSGLSTLDAAGVRTAVGLASANLDTQLAAIDNFIDTEVAAIKAVTDKLDTAMELDSTVYRFTVNALEQAPSGGGGGSTDWTADERTAIRTILGVPASGTTPDVPSAGALKVIDDFLDTEIAAIKAKTDNLPASPAATSDIATALGTGTWATAIPWNAAWDAEVQSECTDALNAYDPPTNAEMEARTLAAASYATAATQTTIVGHVDTLETEVAKVIKSGESRTIARAGETSITFTETRA